MGLHILVARDLKNAGHELREDHPAWDSDRWSGDREFETACLGSDLIWHPDWDGRWFRPADTTRLREESLSKGLEPADRYLKLLDILDADPDVWVYFSH